jgi:hypothetical protein
MHQPNEQEKYRNAPYVRIVRVSDAGERQNSDEAQLLFLKNWADERGMLHVADFVENDLSGSLPGNRTDLRAVLDRADRLGDFKYVLSQRVDRATRGGADHYFWFKADAAQESASSTGQRSAQGSEFALEARRVSPHSHTPFGCYRLYCRGDGTPLHVIVDKRNGLQEKRSWPDLTLVDTYGTVGGGQVGHYRKQKSELVFLVPGDPYERETVVLTRRVDGRAGAADGPAGGRHRDEGGGVRVPLPGVDGHSRPENEPRRVVYTGQFGVLNWPAYTTRSVAAHPAGVRQLPVHSAFTIRVLSLQQDCPICCLKGEPEWV